MDQVSSICIEAFKQVQVPLVYTYVITFSFSLLMIYLVGLGTKKTPLSNTFIVICSLICWWILLNTLTWFGFASDLVIQAGWAPTEFISVLMFVSVFYFVYAFASREQMSQKIKFVLGAIVAPVLVLAPTQYYMTGYDAVQCEVIENMAYIQYASAIKILCMVLAAYFLWRMWVEKVYSRRTLQVLLVAIVSFLMTFFITSYVASITENFLYEIYGLFGIIVFLGCLAYLVSSEKLFNTKVFASPVLIGILFIVNLPSVYFYKEPIDLILWTAESIVILALGYFLIRSVKNEIRQRELLAIKTTDLETTNEKLKELDRAKTEFLSFATHQLKSPLTAIKWGVGALRDTKLDANQDMIAGQVLATSEKMVRTVNDFLGAAKLETGQLVLNKTEVEITTILKKVFNEFQTTAQAKKLELKLSLPSSPLVLKLDEIKVSEVVANLVDNAIKYTTSGSVNIGAESDGRNIRIIIKDTGAGMLPEEADTLFQKYKRGSAAQLNMGGSGIGLFLGKQIIQMHGGALSAYSEGKGRGSEFVIELPLHEIVPVQLETVPTQSA